MDDSLLNYIQILMVENGCTRTGARESFCCNLKLMPTPPERYFAIKNKAKHSAEYKVSRLNQKDNLVTKGRQGREQYGGN
jgi:hypothetical protein